MKEKMFISTMYEQFLHSTFRFRHRAVRHFEKTDGNLKKNVPSIEFLFTYFIPSFIKAAEGE